MQWNLYALATALRMVAPREALVPALERYPDAYEAAYAAAVVRRLGVESRGGQQDHALARVLNAALAALDDTPERLWFDWRGGALRRPSARYDEASFAPFRSAIAAYQPAPGALDHAYWSHENPETMRIDEVEAIWAAIAERDDWQPFVAKVAAVRDMGAAYRGPPDDIQEDRA